jgi:hypothetical protein
MTTRCSSRMLALLVGAVLAFTATFALGSSEANAQCNRVTIINNTHCTVTVWIVCPTHVIGPITVPPGGIVHVPLPATCNPIRVATLVCGNRTLIPNSGCLNNVPVANNCCADVCFNPLNCTVTFTQVNGLCLCP